MFFIIPLILFSLIGGCLLIGVLASKYHEFTSPEYNFSIKYPSDWQMVKPEQGAVVVFLSPKENDLDTFQANVNVVVQDLSAQSMTLEQYAKLALDQLTGTFKDVDVVENAPTTVGKLSGHKLVYAAQGESPLKIMTVMVLQDDVAYSIFFTSEFNKFDQYVAQINDVVNSFRLL